MQPPISQISQISLFSDPDLNLHYTLAKSCFSEKVLPFPVKSANLRNLRIKAVRSFGCGSQAALCNLRSLWSQESFT
jgi:hypothetical protein